MSASSSSQSRKEDQVLVLVVGASIALFLAGFRSGWKKGRMDLLISLDRATRIQRQLKEE